MILNILLIIISIFIENIFNLYLNMFKYIAPLFTLLSLIFIFPYFKNAKKEYYIFSFFSGLLYDLFFTNFYVLNSIIFFIISIGMFYILRNHKNNYITIVYTSLFSIFLYNLINFLIFNMFNYYNYSLIDLSYILRHFLLGNLLYVTILYLFLKKRYFKHIINS